MTLVCFSSTNDINTLVNKLKVKLINKCAWLDATYLTLDLDKTIHLIFHCHKPVDQYISSIFLMVMPSDELMMQSFPAS